MMVVYRYRHGWIPVGGSDAHTRPNRFFPTATETSVPLPPPVGQRELRDHLIDVHGIERYDIGASPRVRHDLEHSGPGGDHWTPPYGAVDTQQNHYHPASGAAKVDLSKVDDVKLHTMLQDAKVNNQPDIVKILRAEQDRRTAKLTATHNSA